MEKLVNIRKIIRENVKRRILLEITLKTIEKDIEAASKLDVIDAELKNRLNKHKANLIKRSQKKMRNKKRKARVGSAINNIQSITNPKKANRSNEKQRTNGRKSKSAPNAGTTASSETIKWKQYKKQTAWLYRLNTETNNWETKKVSTGKVFVLGHPDGKTGLKQKKYLKTISLLNTAFVSDLDAAKIDKSKRYVHVKKTETTTAKTSSKKTSTTGGGDADYGESDSSDELPNAAITLKVLKELIRKTSYVAPSTSTGVPNLSSIPISCIDDEDGSDKRINVKGGGTSAGDHRYNSVSEFLKSGTGTSEYFNNKGDTVNSNYTLYIGRTFITKTSKKLGDCEVFDLYVDGTSYYNARIGGYTSIKNGTNNKHYVVPFETVK